MHEWMNWADLAYWKDVGRDLLGYSAGALVLGTFAMKSMRPLRLTAIASNLAFICYSLVMDLHPILVLHGILLPLNIFRLAQTETATVQSLFVLARKPAFATALMIFLTASVAAAAISSGMHADRPVVSMADWPLGSI